MTVDIQSPMGNTLTYNSKGSLDPEIVKITLSAVAGVLDYLSSLDESLKREFSLKLAANTVTSAESLIRTVKLNQILELNGDLNTATIVENFLKSLNEHSTGDTET
jgi:hypothetical protein